MARVGWMVGFAVVALAATASSRQMFQTPAPDVVVTDSYSSSDFGKISVVGVCDVMGPSVRCWHPDGRRDAELAKLVTEDFANVASHNGGTHAEIKFHFRKKNRILVVEEVPNEATAGLTPSLAGLALISHGYMDLVDGTFRTSRISHRWYWQLESESTAKSASVYANLGFFYPNRLTIAPTSGATAAVENLRLTVGQIGLEAASHPAGTSYSKNRIWDVELKISSDRSAPPMSIGVDPLDKNGKPFQYVDEQGRPGPVPPGYGIESGGAGGGRFVTPNANRTDISYRRETGAYVWRTAADPAFLSTLRVSLFGSRCVEFKDIRLDPNH